MRDYSLSHLSDAVLLRDLDTLIAQECVTIADVLAHIAEVDARKLYAPAGYRSMFAYCVAVLRFSEDAAGKRIHAARTARQYPVLFKALAEGRLHMTAVCLLAPHLTRKNIGELVEEATYRTKSEIENFLAARYPLPTPPRRTPSAQCELAPELGPRVSEEDPGLPGGCEHAPEHVMLAPTQPEHASEHAASSAIQPEHAPEHAAPSLIQPGPAPEHPAGHVGNARPATSPAPLCQVTIRQSTREKARYTQALLSHSLPSGDLSDVLDRALDLLIAHTQKRRFGAPAVASASAAAGAGSGRFARRRRRGQAGRYIPAAVRRAVWERDGGRCTFVGTTGHHCNSDEFLQFDHIDPRQKENTLAGLRLRCRTHNQLEAERVFGAEFMSRKREEASLVAEGRRAQAEGERNRARGESRAGGARREIRSEA